MTRDVTAGAVARLVAAQFPQWAHFPVTAVSHGDWDNHTFRLGRSCWHACRAPAHTSPRSRRSTAGFRSWLATFVASNLLVGDGRLRAVIDFGCTDRRRPGL